MQAPEEVTAEQQVVATGAETDWEAATAMAVVADAAAVAVAMAEAVGRSQQVGVVIRVRCMARAQQLPGS